MTQRAPCKFTVRHIGRSTIQDALPPDDLPALAARLRSGAVLPADLDAAAAVIEGTAARCPVCLRTEPELQPARICVRLACRKCGQDWGVI